MDSSKKLPLFEFNFVLGENCPWEFVPTAWVPPACVPFDIGGFGCLAKVTGPNESIIISFLRAGAPLNLKQVQAIANSHKLKPPEEGSGKNKNILKVDWIKAVVDHFLADLSNEEKQAIISKINGGKSFHEPTLEAAGENLQLLAQLDPEEKPHFKNIIKEAVDVMEVEGVKERAKRARQQKAQLQPPDDAAAPAAPRDVDMRPAQERRPAEAPRPRAFHGLTKGPEEFRVLLPAVPQLTFHYQPRQRRVVIEFARFSS